MIIRAVFERERSFLTIILSTRQNPRITPKTITHEMGSRREAYEQLI